MRNVHIIRLIGVLTVFALFGAACGDDSDDSSEPTAADEAEPAADDEAEPSDDEAESSEEPAPESDDGASEDALQIALVQEARPDVEPWSASWHDSAEEIMANDPSVTFNETFDAFDPTTAEPVLRQLLDEGAGVAVMSSFFLEDVARVLAAEYPDVPMIVTGFGEPQEPNLDIGTVSYLQAGYAMCWFLGQLSETGKIGYVGAIPVPFDVDMLTGCELGAEAAGVEVETVYTGDDFFSDQQANREQTQLLLDDGITEIYLATGTEDSLGGFRLCEQAGAHCGTWGGDARLYAPTAGVMSIILDWTVIYEDMIEERRSGNMEAEVYDGTFGNGGLKTQSLDGDAAADVSDELKEQFAQIVADLADGTIELPESEAHPGFP